MAMSETDHSTRPLSPEQVVRARLVEGRLFEAGFLLKRIGSELQSSTFRELKDRIEKDVSRVGELVRRAEDLVRQDRLDDAVAVYDEVRTLAVDYPGLNQALRQLQVQRSLGPLEAHGDTGDTGNKEPVESGRHERKEVCGQKKPSFPPSGRFHGITLLGSVVCLAVLVTLAVLFFQTARKPDSQPFVQSVAGETTPREVASHPAPASEPVGIKNSRAHQSSIVPEAVIAPPITDSLPVPKMAAKKPVRVEKQSGGTGGEEMKPLPVFAAGQEQVRVRFLPFHAEADAVKSAPARAQGPDNNSDGSPLSSMDEVTESHSGPIRDKVSPGRENPPKPGQPRALNPDGTYTVQPGDNLGGISLKLFGTSQRWREIFTLNRDILPSPATLRVGQHLKIRLDTSVSDPTEEDTSSAPGLSEEEKVSDGMIEERE
jgi:LysM repeat protein